MPSGGVTLKRRCTYRPAVIYLIINKLLSLSLSRARALSSRSCSRSLAFFSHSRSLLSLSLARALALALALFSSSIRTCSLLSLHIIDAAWPTGHRRALGCGTFAPVMPHALVGSRPPGHLAPLFHTRCSAVAKGAGREKRK